MRTMFDMTAQFLWSDERRSGFVPALMMYGSYDKGLRWWLKKSFRGRFDRGIW